MTSPPTPSSPPPPPLLLLLKTRNTPTDAYATYFSTAPLPLTRLQPIFIPVLQYTIHAASLAHLRALLSLPAHAFPYGGLICTSQRAVEALGQVLDELSPAAAGEDSPPSHEESGTIKSQNPTPPPTAHSLAIPLYTVGPATARALSALQQRHLPRSSVHGDDTGNGAKLAAHILTHYAVTPPTATSTSPVAPAALTTSNGVGLDAARAPLLFLVGEQRRDVIPATLGARGLEPGRRVRVEELEVYATRVVEGFGASFEGWLGGEGRGPVWVAVFSPAGCAEMVKVLRGTERVRGAGGREVYVASIGPTTRDYLLEEFGFRVDVCAERPSPEGLAEGIARFMREREREEGDWIR
ncbi:hypothetical protein MMC26_006586 [Xylographa opegraphella]|nr:hypothetical protein [Xylographa opegraphella]